MKTAAFFLALAASSFFAAHAQRTVVVPEPPELEAKSYIILDYHSGKIIAEKNADDRVDPASLTKLMAAYIIYEALEKKTISADDQVSISKKAWQTEGSRMFIEVGDTIGVGDLIKGMVVQSGNDASVALAEHLAGSEEVFAAIMNQKAGELGMHGSFFKNATGLTEAGHHMTVRDIAVISRRLIRDFPSYYKMYSVREFSHNGIKQHNRNPLLYRDPSVDGIKTGYTKSAGYCLAASAERNGMRLITVVTGNSSDRIRAEDSESLLNYGFRFFATHRLYKAGETLHSMRVWGGAEKTVNLGLEHDFHVTVPRGTQGDIDIKNRIIDKPEAPVQAFQKLGSIEASHNGELLQEAELIALNHVKRGNLLTRMLDAVLILFQ